MSFTAKSIAQFAVNNVAILGSLRDAAAMQLTRRDFCIAALLTAGCQSVGKTNHGVLVPDPADILDLPEGFSYQIIGRAMDRMSDGLRAPARPDGMAAFSRPDGNWSLVRNHENLASQNVYSAFGDQLENLHRVSRELFYDYGQGQMPGTGGTTTLVIDPASGQVVSSHLSLAGTELNCAGGPTPWGSWLSCEECFDDHLLQKTAHFPREQAHGFVFEVDPLASSLQAPRKLPALGKFVHEAAAIDPRNGAVYLTEDRRDGLVYRLLPSQPGDLAQGGRFQALALSGSEQTDTANRDADSQLLRDHWYSVHWIDLPGQDSSNDDLRLRGRELGAARFVRGEGIWFDQGELFFSCTEGGPAHLGQIFHYQSDSGSLNSQSPTGRLRLLVESSADSVLHHADNLCVSPTGSLIVCEDRDSGCGLVLVTTAGDVWRFAQHRKTDSELAGACFSPDGKTLFVNIQKPGLTLAIKGPFAAVL